MQSLIEKRHALLALAARYRATNIRVFGSTARDEETATSDVDLLVDMPADASLYDLIEMTMEIESLLGRRADVLTERALNPHLRERNPGGRATLVKKDRRIYLRHLAECIIRIKTYTVAGRETFLADLKTQDAVIRNVEIIGQVVRDLGIEDLVTRYPETP